MFWRMWLLSRDHTFAVMYFKYNLEENFMEVNIKENVVLVSIVIYWVVPNYSQVFFLFNRNFSPSYKFQEIPIYKIKLLLFEVVRRGLRSREEPSEPSRLSSEIMETLKLFYTVKWHNQICVSQTTPLLSEQTVGGPVNQERHSNSLAADDLLLDKRDRSSFAALSVNMERI